MATRPDDYPRWATTEVEVTEPPESRKASGYVGGDKPRRGWENWIKNEIYKWILYLDESGVSLSFLVEDGAFSTGGSLPSTGAGLGPIAANDFSAAALVSGFLVGTIPSPIQGPEYTYTANTDTYWDLGLGGIWTPTAVANLDPAPAIPADHVRVFKVVTDAGNRTAVEDFRQPVTFPESMIFEAQQTMTSILFRDPEGNEDDYTPRLNFLHDQASFYGQLISQWGTANGARVFRLYRTSSALNPAAGDSLVMAINCKMVSDSAPEWQLDPGQTFAWRWRMAATDFSGSAPGNITQLSFQGVTPPGGAGSTFDETDWADYTDTQERGFFGLNCGLLLGNDLNTEAAAAAQNRSPLLFFAESEFSRWTLVSQSRLNGGSGLVHREYIGQNAFGGGVSFADGRFEGYLRTINARWDEAAFEWVADSAGNESAGFLISNEGYSYLKRDNLDPSTWPDEVWDGAEGWRATDTRVEDFGNEQRELKPFRDVVAKGFRYHNGSKTVMYHLTGSEFGLDGDVGINSGAFADPQTVQWFGSGAIAANACAALVRLPDGGTIEEAVARASSPSGDILWNIYRQPIAGGAPVALRSGGSQAMSAATTTYTCDQNNVIDNTAYRYFVKFYRNTTSAAAPELDNVAIEISLTEILL